MHIRLYLATAIIAISNAAWAVEKPFDPAGDAAKDLLAAEQQAKTEHKNILMDVGGNWCGWCIVLDRTLSGDAELHALLTKNYIFVHVNFSTENENAAFLAKYPAASGYPAWYVLSADGKLLKAEDTSDLEQNHQLNAGYNREALKKFLLANAPE